MRGFPTGTIRRTGKEGPSIQSSIGMEIATAGVIFRITTAPVHQRTARAGARHPRMAVQRPLGFNDAQASRGARSVAREPRRAE
jgi:hypothetical protein